MPDTQVSSYLQHLPALFQQDTDTGDVPFIGRFLLAFEKLLTGLEDETQPGLEEILDGISDPTSTAPKLAGIHRYFRPGPGLEDSQRTNEAFLEWLAGWVALSLQDNWTAEEKRRFIAEIVPSYRKRGTKAGLESVLTAYTGMGANVRELLEPLQLGVTSTVGVDTTIGGAPPHYFLVEVFFKLSDVSVLEEKKQIVRQIIDREKPAHTYYDLVPKIPKLQIGVRSTVGVDTLLGD
ncbi:NHL repeat domain protein [Geitlerinema sp. FC II]|nr:NHL repeat domain protein [Geitlerinema sp. FC II]